MRNLVVLGAGGFARQIISILDEVDSASMSYSLYGFLDADGESSLEGVPVLGGDEVLATVDADYVIGVGSPGLRAKLGTFADSLDHEPATLIHPTARVDRRASVGRGAIVAECAHIQYGATLGRHVVVNINTIVCHDSYIGDYSALTMNVMVGAGAQIGNEVFCGMNSVVLGGITVGDRATIGAGAVVTRDVPPDSCMVGVPARPVQRV